PVLPTACTTSPIVSLPMVASVACVRLIKWGKMPRPDTSAAVSVERFFQFSLLGLVASGYFAVAGSGYLDSPTVVLTAAGLLLRGLLIYGFVPLEMSERS